jgi:hypothetical protein
MVHALKTDPEFFEDVAAGNKGFEVRKNDRPYKTSDFVALNEWKDKEYTGRFVFMKIVYILDDPQYCKDGYVILGLKPCEMRILAGFETDPFVRNGRGIPVYSREA